jgi:hypothetical protein
MDVINAYLVVADYNLFNPAQNIDSKRNRDLGRVSI